VPLAVGKEFNAVNLLSVWNPSRRVTATNLRLRIVLPTDRDAVIGDVSSFEWPAGASYEVSSPQGGNVVISMSVDRIAPSSKIEVPIWWYASDAKNRPISGAVTAEGTTDQCVLKQGPGLDWTRRWNLALYSYAGLFGLLIGLWAGARLSALMCHRPSTG
jgi:hypothetical protein